MIHLTHRQIEVFRALMLTTSATRAAELLRTSQPTISRELARLEHGTGLQLFERVRGRLQPTARAGALYAEVERAWIGLERIGEVAGTLARDGQARLALACLPALAHALLPDAAARFYARHPDAALSITPLDSPQLEARLGEQRYDLGLIEQREAPRGTTLVPLLEADEVAVLPAGHPLAARRTLRPQDFADAAFVSLAPDDPYRRQIDALFDARGVARRLRVEAGSAAAVCALVRQGLGVAIVNPLTALEFAATGLAVRRLSVPIPFRVTLALPEFRAAEPLREALVAALHDAARAVQSRLRKAMAG